MSAHHRALLKRYGRRAWEEARVEAKARARFRCARCGATERLEVHHVRPVSAGGAALDQANLRVLCRDCHFRTHPGRVERMMRDWAEFVDEALVDTARKNHPPGAVPTARESERGGEEPVDDGADDGNDKRGGQDGGNGAA